MNPDRVPFKPDAEPELAPQARDFSRSEGLSYLDYSEYHRMSDFLGLNDAERRAPKVAEQVAYLTDWAQAVTGSNDTARQMQAINELKRSLGSTYKGNELTTLLYRYARLDEQKRSLEGEMSAYTEKSQLKPAIRRKVVAKPKNIIQSNIDKQLKNVSGVIQKKVNDTISLQVGKALDNAMKQFGR